MTNLPPLPATIEFDMQPYGAMTLGNLRLGDYGGHPTLTGVAIEGVEVSRLFGQSIAKSIAGQRRTIYGIKADEITRGRVVRVAM